MNNPFFDRDPRNELEDAKVSTGGKIIQGCVPHLAWAIALRFPTMINDMPSRKFLFLSPNSWDIFWSLAI